MYEPIDFASFHERYGVALFALVRLLIRERVPTCTLFIVSNTVQPMVLPGLFQSDSLA